MKKLVEVRVEDFDIINGKLFVKIAVKIPHKNTRHRWINYVDVVNLTNEQMEKLRN